MEFNKIINSNSSVDNTVDTAFSTTQNQIVLKSPSGASSKTLNASLSIDVTPNDNSVLVNFSSKDVVLQFDPNNVRTKLLTVYGKSGRLYVTTRDIETISIKPSEFPARLEYEFISIDDNKIETKYTAVYNVPQFSSSSRINLNTELNTTTITADTPSAINLLDSEIYNIKNNLQNFSTFYDNSLKKDVSLHNTVINILTRLDNLTLEVNALKEKTKDL
jgi:hypothetical protein